MVSLVCFGAMQRNEQQTLARGVGFLADACKQKWQGGTIHAACKQNRQGSTAQARCLQPARLHAPVVT